jgi:hypothetical protein
MVPSARLVTGHCALAATPAVQYLTVVPGVVRFIVKAYKLLCAGTSAGSHVNVSCGRRSCDAPPGCSLDMMRDTTQRNALDRLYIHARDNTGM